DAILAGATDHRIGRRRDRAEPAEDQRPAASGRDLRRRARLLLRLYPATRRPLLERPGRSERRAAQTRRALDDGGSCRPLRPLEAEPATSGSRWDFFPPGPTTPLRMSPACASATK